MNAGVVLLLLVSLLFYFLPAFMAYRRNRQPAAVFILNLFFGWTLVGWVAALIWAASNGPQAAQPEPRA